MKARANCRVFTPEFFIGSLRIRVSVPEIILTQAFAAVEYM